MNRKTFCSSCNHISLLFISFLYFEKKIKEMNYQQTVEYLFSSTPLFEKVGAPAYKEGLANTHALDDHFGHPHRKFHTIHIAGTNGKGSCSHTISSILQAAGYNVGLYTSPHLVDFRERIRVNGKCISKQYVVDFVEKERYFFEPLHPSFFELTTALAFNYFAEQEIDIAVIEVGLGGRLDCTNIITPILSVITNISFDHTQFLGNTLTNIAYEKAGIIKNGIPVIVGEANPETRHVFVTKATECKAPIFFAEDTNEIIKAKIKANGGIDYYTINYGHISGELFGYYQLKNTNTVLHAITEICKHGFAITKAQVAEGFANVCYLTGLQGRWQKLSDHPLVVCDTGHNVGGWEYLSEQINAQKCDKIRMVFGMVDDKDIDSVMNLLPRTAKYYFTQASTHRAIPADVMYAKAQQHGLVGSYYPTVSEAYNKALAESSEKDFLFVGGSSYVVADFLSSIEHRV